MNQNNYKKKLEYNRNYNAMHYKSISLRFDLVKDKKVIDWLLMHSNIKEYIVNLVLKDMEANYED